MKRYADGLAAQEAHRALTWDEVDACEDADRLRNEVRRLQNVVADLYWYVGRKVTAREAKTGNYMTLVRETAEHKMQREASQ